MISLEYRIPNIHFAIISSVFRRNSDPEFLLPLNRSIASILKQNFKNWTLILIGDGLILSDYDKMNNKLKSVIPVNKLIFQNLDIAKREENELKGQNFYNCTLWCFAGTNALNEGLNIASKLLHVTHIARLDDDDYWYPNHLEIMIQAFQLKSNIGFVYSQTHTYTDLKFLQPQIEKPYSAKHEFSFHPPVPSKVIHSAVAWSAKIPELRSLRYRHPYEQYLSTRTSRKICCHFPYQWPHLKQCSPGIVMAVDADMWERINTLVVEEKRFRSVFVHKVTVIYLFDKEKGLLIKKLY